MREILLILFGLSLAYAPAIAQEINNEPTEYEILKEQLKLQYEHMNPEDIWREYISKPNVSVGSLAFDIGRFKSPYYNWGVEEILKKEIDPKTCGMLLHSSGYELSSKNKFVKKCMSRAYTFEDFDNFAWGMAGSTGTVSPDHMEKLISMVLENWDLSNPQLITLLTNSSSTKQKIEIISRININELDSFNACIISNQDVPSYQEIFKSLCDYYSTNLFAPDSAKSFVLEEMMKKEDKIPQP